VYTEGVLYTWGDGDNGRLGHSNEQEEEAPCVVVAFEGQRLAMVSCGDS
jgi:hypothetical protein